MSQEASSPTAPEHPVDAAQQKREQELQRALTTFKDGRTNEAIGICRDLLAKTRVWPARRATFHNCFG